MLEIVIAAVAIVVVTAWPELRAHWEERQRRQRRQRRSVQTSAAE